MKAAARPAINRECKECGSAFTTVWPRKIYCDACGAARRQTSRRLTVNARRRVESAAIETIAQTRGKQTTRLTDSIGRPDLAWKVFFAIPFSMDASKNRRWSNNGKGAVYLTRSVRAYQEMVVHATRQALCGQRVAQNKLWLGFHVEKPNNRSDAINVVDTLCDAIKVATDLDDRWFCLERVDWEIKKRDPQIIVTIGQESSEDVIVCSHCGEMKGLDHYNKHSRNPLGRSRVCRDCRKIIDAAAREERKRLAEQKAERGAA